MNTLDKKTNEEFNKLFNVYALDNIECINTKDAKKLKQFIANKKAEWIEEVRERVIKAVLEVADKYWINKYVGMPASVVVNKEQFKAIIEDELNKKE